MFRILFIVLLNFLTIGGNAQIAPVYLDPFHEIRSGNPDVADAINLIRFGDYDGAISMLRKIRKSAARSYEVYYLLGVAHKLKGEIGEAISSFTSATHEDGYFIPAFFERGNCYLIREQFKLAVFDYDRVILIDSGFVPAYNNRAYARIRNYGNKETPVFQLKFAREDLLKAMSISAANGEDKRFETYFNLGLIDLFQSEYARAAASLDTAIMANNSVPKAYYFRGAARFLNRDYELAETDFIYASELGFMHPDTPEFLRVIQLIENHKRSLNE